MSAAAARPARAPRGDGGNDRALTVSWAISLALGAAWVGLVVAGPHAEPALTLRPPAEPPRVVVTLAPEPPPARVTPPRPAPVPSATPPVAPPPSRPTADRPREAAAPRPAPVAPRAPTRAPEPPDLAAAFGGAGSAVPGAPPGDAGAVLSRVRVRASGDDAGAAAGTRASLADGATAGGQPTPGRARGAAAAGAAIGTVGATGGVARAAVRVLEPHAVAGPAGSGAGQGGAGSARLGGEARRRESELRVCYAERGLRADAGLAGRVTLAITVAATGAVSDAEVRDRSWAGAGAEAAERCILQRVRGWRLGSAGGEGRYELSFSFTR